MGAGFRVSFVIVVALLLLRFVVLVAVVLVGAALLFCGFRFRD